MGQHLRGATFSGCAMPQTHDTRSIIIYCHRASKVLQPGKPYESPWVFPLVQS